MIIRDDNSNTWDTEYWGSESAAKEAQASCSRCSDCSDCSRCSGCAPSPIGMEIPAIEDIHKKIYAAVTYTPASLDMSSFHKCETTHCRAGWVVHLAGEAGYALEKATSPEFAAMQIYKKSGYEIAPTRFYDSNEVALADMRRLAEGVPS